MVLEQVERLLPEQSQIRLRHKATLAGHGVDQPLGLQFVIGPLGGDDGDPQVLGQGPDGGQRLSGGEIPGNDLGFDLGVDEYITKPFSPKILVARVAAILRRTTDAASDEKLVAGGIEMNLSAHVVTIDGKPVELSFKEFELLQYFITNKGVALSREKILNNVWNYDYFGDARTIDTHVKKLRSKMGDKGEYIKTIWGMGYKFEVE